MLPPSPLRFPHSPLCFTRGNCCSLKKIICFIPGCRNFSKSWFKFRLITILVLWKIQHGWAQSPRDERLELTAEVFCSPVEHHLMGHSTLPWILRERRASAVILSRLAAVLHVNLAANDKPVLRHAAGWWHQVKELSADQGLNRERKKIVPSGVSPVWKPQQKITAGYAVSCLFVCFSSPCSLAT